MAMPVSLVSLSDLPEEVRTEVTRRLEEAKYSKKLDSLIDSYQQGSVEREYVHNRLFKASSERGIDISAYLTKIIEIDRSKENSGLIRAAG